MTALFCWYPGANYWLNPQIWVWGYMLGLRPNFYDWWLSWNLCFLFVSASFWFPHIFGISFVVHFLQFQHISSTSKQWRKAHVPSSLWNLAMFCGFLWILTQLTAITSQTKIMDTPAKQFLTQPMDPEKKSLNYFPYTKYVIPKSLKFSHWPSKIYSSQKNNSNETHAPTSRHPPSDHQKEHSTLQRCRWWHWYSTKVRFEDQKYYESPRHQCTLRVQDGHPSGCK